MHDPSHIELAVRCGHCCQVSHITPGRPLGNCQGCGLSHLNEDALYDELALKQSAVADYLNALSLSQRQEQAISVALAHWSSDRKTARDALMSTLDKGETHEQPVQPF